MLRRDILLVLIAVVNWSSVGCRGEAAPSPLRPQAKISSGSAAPIHEARQTSRNATHARNFRKDSHESFLATYNNPEEGISFRYPRNYSLEEGDVQEHSFFLQRQDDLDSEQPGAKLLATVLIPEDAYPNTTFEHGSLQLVINEAETENGCLEMSEVEATGNRYRALVAQGLALHWSGQETEIAGTKTVQRKYAGYAQGTCYQFRVTLAADESPDPNGFTKTADLLRIIKQLENVVTSSRIFAKTALPPAEPADETIACDYNHPSVPRISASPDPCLVE
jgi:hypothetical protein